VGRRAGAQKYGGAFEVGPARMLDGSRLLWTSSLDESHNLRNREGKTYRATSEYKQEFAAKEKANNAKKAPPKPTVKAE
jgi:hypothetical protein